jgi:hypothetical protein
LYERNPEGEPSRLFTIIPHNWFQGGLSIPTHDLTLIFHGADVFDYGDAARLISLLHPRLSLVAGVMARTAAEESGLLVTYDGRRPSEILAEYPLDQVVLIHRAKPMLLLTGSGLSSTPTSKIGGSFLSIPELARSLPGNLAIPLSQHGCQR